MRESTEAQKIELFGRGIMLSSNHFFFLPPFDTSSRNQASKASYHLPNPRGKTKLRCIHKSRHRAEK